MAGEPGVGCRSRETGPLDGGGDVGVVLEGGSAGGASELSRDSGTRRSYIGSHVSLDRVCSLGTVAPSPTTVLFWLVSPQRYVAALRLASTLEGDATPPAFGAPKTDGNVKGERGEVGKCSYRGSAPPLSSCGAIEGAWATILLAPSAPVLPALEGLRPLWGSGPALEGLKPPWGSGPALEGLKPPWGAGPALESLRPLLEDRSELTLETPEGGRCKERLSWVDRESDLL